MNLHYLNINEENMMRQKKGFTLIELLVVMAIIAVLAAVGMASYRSANERGRNARRASDLEQVRAALEMYRTDNSGYPAEATFTDMVAELQSAGYLTTPPQDPLNGVYYYCYEENATLVPINYELCAEFEGTPPGTCSSGFTDGSTSCSGGNYGVRNP